MPGVLFDAESVIKGAREKLEAAGLAQRCETVAGDFFKAGPEGGDIMLVITGGLERTEDEFRQLLDASGFKLTRFVPTQTPFSVVESVPV
jgi:hypothetical protein